MARSRKQTRRHRSRKHRGGSATRKGLVSKIYSPVGHLFNAAENSVHAITSGADKIVSAGIGSVNKIGKSITGHADQAVHNVMSRKRRGGKRRGSRKGRKGSRKTTRKHRGGKRGRKGSRKSRKGRKGSRKH